MAKAETPQQDAGMRSLNHYYRRLPRWRFAMREYLVPIVRWETPYIARLQQQLRSPALDTYFALAANLGTHTFFTIILPFLFWCGQVRLARAMTHVLASGVFFSGFAKDLLCLPRPMSPPLQRISKSASAALEYGFPSTHSTNAVSVAMYAIYALGSKSTDSTSSPSESLLRGVFYFYAVSIVVGRMYCGMHGLFDVIAGSILGAAIAFVQIQYGKLFDSWVIDGSFRNILIITLVVLVLVRVHPEPADDCPCFDDSVAFSGVMIGVQLGSWHYARSGYAWDKPLPSTAPFSLEELGWTKVVLRTVVGVFVIFAWRGLMKPTLLKVLPPLFRIIETLGLSLPRKFHLQASKYKTVPPLKKDDGVIPSPSEIPDLLTSLRHPRRRTVSIGPQSQADAYEAMAFRELRRRESGTSSGLAPNGSPKHAPLKPTAATEPPPPPPRSASPEFVTEPFPLPEPAAMMQTLPDADANAIAISDADADADAHMFSQLQVPRVRYDVEVVTKLIVYTGIAWLAVEGNPVLFELFGLGLGVRPP